jgi:hypothetical protein
MGSGKLQINGLGERSREWQGFLSSTLHARTDTIWKRWLALITEEQAPETSVSVTNRRRMSTRYNIFQCWWCNAMDSPHYVPAWRAVRRDQSSVSAVSVGSNHVYHCFEVLSCPRLRQSGAVVEHRFTTTFGLLFNKQSWFVSSSQSATTRKVTFLLVRGNSSTNSTSLL